MNKITKDNIDIIKTRILEALLPVGEELGLSFDFGRGTYNPNNFVTQLEVMIDNDDGVAMSREATNFQQYSWKYGLRSDQLGVVFTSDNSSYRIVGCKIKNRKYPIIVEDINSGNRYKFAASTVKTAVDKVEATIEQAGELPTPQEQAEFEQYAREEGG